MTGAGGLLGSELVRLGSDTGHRRAGGSPAKTEILGLPRALLDVTDGVEVGNVIGELEPDWVVHCAAYTAVDRAEEEPDQAMSVNHGGTVNVASAAARHGARLLYVSTDYVFDGQKREPYLPSDEVRPLSVYAQTKLAGEEAALASGGVAIRTGWLYGRGGGNFVDAILRRAEGGASLRVVDDQRGRPTWARNVAVGIFDLLVRGLFEQGLTPVVHLADGGDATWLEFAREAVRLRGLDVPVEGVSTAEWGAAAPRPAYSILDLSAVEGALGRPMMHWKDALSQYLVERDEASRSGDP